MWGSGRRRGLDQGRGADIGKEMMDLRGEIRGGVNRAFFPLWGSLRPQVHLP